VQPPEPEVRLARSQVQPATTPVVRIDPGVPQAGQALRGRFASLDT
jgi:hypothetical protein